MKKVQCKNGHYYDEDIGYCPECKGKTKLLDRSKTEYIKKEKNQHKKSSNGMWLKLISFVMLVIIAIGIIFYDMLFPTPTIPSVISEQNNSLVSSVITETNSSVNVNTLKENNAPLVENNISTTESNQTTETNSSTVITSNTDINTTTTIENNSSVAKPIVVEENNKSDVLVDIKKRLEKKSTTELKKTTYNFVGDK